MGSRDDIFLTRHSSAPAVAEGSGERAVINRMAIAEVVRFFDQLVLSGKCFSVQAGTEDAPVTATGAIDDQLAMILVDNNAGYSMIPLLYEFNIGTSTDTATLLMGMLEVDKLIKRYASGGTAFVPANMHAQNPSSWNGVAYTSGASDVVAAAKSAVPNSVELARKFIHEDALANMIGYPGARNPCVYSVKKRPMCVTYGASSLIGHLGSTTADCAVYATIEVAQLETAQVSAA